MSRATGLGVRWHRTRRHTRLKVAVLGCLVVMFALVVALGATLWRLDRAHRAHLTAGDRWLVAAEQASTTSALAGAWSGAGTSVRADLTLALDELGAALRTADPRGVEPATGEAWDLIERTRDAVDGTAAQRTRAEARIRSLSVRFAAVADDFSAQSRAHVEAARRLVADWILGIQIVGVVSAVVFLWVVATQILPLMASIRRSMEELRERNAAVAADRRRRTLLQQINDGLEVAETEAAAYAVIERAMAVAAPDSAAEMLLADSSQAHLGAAVVHPLHGGGGCDVASPWSCPAVRRGTTQVFEDSGAIRACPHLSRRATRCSAICAPMTSMGQPMGVLHVTGPAGVRPGDEEIEAVGMLASESASRIGTLRAFARAELQAATDVLTGLPNRRATEERLQRLLRSADGGAVGVVELVGVASLQATAGAVAGDHAFKVAAEALLHGRREDDFCGRWSGAEFVLALPGMAVREAREVTERAAADVVRQLDLAGLHGVEVRVGAAEAAAAGSAHELMELVERDRRGGEPPATEENLPDRQLSGT